MHISFFSLSICVLCIHLLGLIGLLMDNNTLYMEHHQPLKKIMIRQNTIFTIPFRVPKYVIFSTFIFFYSGLHFNILSGVSDSLNE